MRFHPASPAYRERFHLYGAARHMPVAVPAVAAGVSAGIGAALTPGISLVAAATPGIGVCGIRIIAS